MINELKEEQYLATMTFKMVDITSTVVPIVDIWDYVEALTNEKQLDKSVAENGIVEKVYSNESNTIHHVLLPTEIHNIFIVILIDVLEKVIIGHYKLDLNEKYGIF